MIKSVVTGCSCNNPKPFPKLMKSKTDPKCITYMSDSGKGTYIFHADGYCLGRYSEKWNMNNMEDFEGSITLSNE